MKKKKILLLYTDKYYLIKQVYPFGLDLIANYLREYGHEVTIDYPFLPDVDLEANLLNILQKTDPHIIGLGIRNIDTCMSCEKYGDYGSDEYKTFYFLPDVKRIVDIIKKYAPDLPVIVGGGAFTISPAAILKYLGIKYGVVGKGEKPLRQFIDAFPTMEGVSKIPNLIYHDGNYVTNQRQDYRFEKKLGPFGRDIKFNYAFERAGIPLQVKRGCNQRCSYCVEPLIEGRRFFYRKIDSVIDELRIISKAHDGANTVFFVDTEFNLPDLTYCSRLVKKIIDNGLHEHFQFSSQFLPRPFNREFAKILAEAGFSIIFTCDSFSNYILEKNQTSYHRDDIIRALEICEEYGIGCSVAMIFGLPGETYETIDQSLEQMKRFPPNFLRRYEYTVGGRIYQATPLCQFVEKRSGESHLYGIPSEGYLEPYYFCSPENPIKLKKYIDQTSGYPIAYENFCDETLFRTLALSYLADQGRWEEVTTLFFKSDLLVQSSIYEYFFRKLTEGGRLDDARAISEGLLLAIQENGTPPQYREQIDLINFYLNCMI